MYKKKALIKKIKATSSMSIYKKELLFASLTVNEKKTGFKITQE